MNGMEPVRAEREFDSYTYDMVRMTLQYADMTLRYPTRKLSPLGQRAVSLYKEACLDFLSMKGGEVTTPEVLEVQMESIAGIRMYESINLHQFMLSLRDKILQLKRIEVYSHYGRLSTVSM